jgi:hypothetical protein
VEVIMSRHAELPVDLDLARNMLGPLGPEPRARLAAVLADPTNETWEAAHSIVLNPDVGMGLTLWQAVIEMDPTFPKTGPTWGPGSDEPRAWGRIPSAHLLRQAINFATR